MRPIRLLVVLALGAPGALASCSAEATQRGCADPIQAGELVITEVFADSVASTGGTDTGKEWIEIYNAAERPVELDGVIVTSSRADGSAARSSQLAELVVAPGQYLTLGNAPADQRPPYVDVGYGSDLGDLYNTERGKLTLRCGDDVIDTATYEAVKPGHSRELTSAQPPTAMLNDDPTAWCQGNQTEFEAGNFGTPGQDSDCQPSVAGACLDGGASRDVVPPKAGELVITEVMPSPARVADAAGEWFEATARAAFDLNGVGLDRAGDTAPASLITSLDCVRVAAGDRIVFARSADPGANGGLPAVSGTFGFALIAGSPTAKGDVQIVAGTAVVDGITWTGSRTGTALQLDPSLVDAQSNDDPANFCDATTPYGLGDLGTPGAANHACTALPPPGMCSDAGTLRAIVKPAAGALKISEIIPNPRIEPDQEWFEITNTSQAAFDLNELALDRAGDTRAPDAIHAAECRSVAPGAFALFARSADPAVNGMLPAVDATFGLSMPNAGGDVRVLDGTTVLDAVTWSSSTDGVSAQLVPTACRAVAPYGDGTNQGTPRAANACN